MSTEQPETFEDKLADLAKGFLNVNGPYDAMARYQDFRQLFTGTEQGRRVLYQILGWGHMFGNVAANGQFDPYRVMFFSGENNLALKIFGTAHKEPKPQPTQTNKQPQKGKSQ
jgi:hypothetical protein